MILTYFNLFWIIDIYIYIYKGQDRSSVILKVNLSLSLYIYIYIITICVNILLLVLVLVLLLVIVISISVCEFHNALHPPQAANLSFIGSSCLSFCRLLSPRKETNRENVSRDGSIYDMLPSCTTYIMYAIRNMFLARFRWNSGRACKQAGNPQIT